MIDFYNDAIKKYDIKYSEEEEGEDWNYYFLIWLPYIPYKLIEYIK